ncbi:MAG: hypothetical protein QW719_01920 [Candidatus Micrarchaeaceae archaeon]
MKQKKNSGTKIVIEIVILLVIMSTFIATAAFLLLCISNLPPPPATNNAITPISAVLVSIPQSHPNDQFGSFGGKIWNNIIEEIEAIE